MEQLLHSFIKRKNFKSAVFIALTVSKMTAVHIGEENNAQSPLHYKCALPYKSQAP